MQNVSAIPSERATPVAARPASATERLVDRALWLYPFVAPPLLFPTFAPLWTGLAALAIPLLFVLRRRAAGRTAAAGRLSGHSARSRGKCRARGRPRSAPAACGDAAGWAEHAVGRTTRRVGRLRHAAHPTVTRSRRGKRRRSMMFSINVNRSHKDRACPRRTRV